MSTLQKDFTIPGVACTSQEDQENMTLKVTLLSSEWKSSTNGDLSTINRELAIQLAKHPNVDVSVLLPNCSEADRSSAESHNVKLVEADRVPGFEPVLCLSFPPRDHTIDCVIGHGVHLGRPIASMKRNPNYSHCKWMQVVHSAPEEDGMYKDISEGQKMQETEIQLCKMADQVITIGPKLAEAYKCYLCAAKQEEKVFDLTPSIFSEFLAVEQATKQRRTFRILLIGSGDSCEDFNVKGYDIASKAISELKDESYKLKFVCAAGGKGDIVAENLLHHGISRNQLIVCSFDDNREVLANLFCEVDLAIMPSRTEGFGTTALEALSAALPVLVSGNSGLGEVLKKVPLGPQSVIDSEDPKEWAREIKRVCQKERDVRLSESRFLREKYLEKYNWEEPCKSLVIKMKNLVFGKALHSSLDYEETEQNKQGESIPGAVPRDSTKQAQRNAKEAWTAADKAPNTSLKGKRTDGDEQTKSVQVKIPIWIDCGTIPDPHPQLETSGTVVIASQGTQAGSDGLIVTKTSEGTPQDTQDSQAGSHELLVTGVKCKAVESVASAGQPFVGRTGSVEEAGVGNKAVPKAQEVLNCIAHNYFMVVDPSKPEELNGFLQYLKDVRKVLVLNVQPGSLILTALCSSLEILDALWYDYCTGHLNDMAQKYLVTRDVLKEFDLAELKLTTTIQGEDYIAARKFLLQGSEKAPNTSLERKRTDGNEEAKSVQGNLPHSGVQVGKRDGREQSESAPDSGTAPCDSPEEVRAATSMALEGAAAYVSTKQAQRNTKEVWTATEKAPNTSLKGKRIDGNEQTKSVQDSGTVRCGSTEEELNNEKEVCAATCTAVEGDTSVSENNKELNQLHSVEKEGDVTEMKSTLPRGFSVDSRNTTGRTPLMNAALNGNVQAVKSMIKRGADPSLTDNKGWNTLHYAAQGGDTDIISLIYNHLPNIESKAGQGVTPLMVAAFTGKLHAVKWLLEKGAAIAGEDKRGWNMLHFAAEGGDTDIISLIHTHLPNVESKTGEGQTPLMVAASCGELHAVKWFLEKGATVACECNRGWNTLHCAAEGGDSDIISLIHTHLPNIESKTGEGHTPLMVAAFNGKLHAVKWFLEKGAAVACESKRGWNTLHHTAQGGDTDIISLIHTHLPNIESKTGEGYTPLMVAAFCGKLHAVKWFLEKGATVACEDKRGWNTLHCAAQGGDTDIISLIHTHLPNIESKTGEGYTPLMVAAFNGKLHAVKWFLKKGAATACKDKKGWSPLHHAAKGGDPDTIDLILTHLPDVDSKTADGVTPLIIAVSYGKLQGVKYLLERGANPLAKDNKGQDSLYHASSCDSDCFDLLLNHVPRSESTTGSD